MTDKASIRALVIEDEKLAQQRLLGLLEKYSETIEIVGIVGDGKQAVERINSLKPELLFLDIQMPFLTGFEVLQEIDLDPLIVFTTAYNEFAIKAFEQNSIDYLLKPLTEERLDKTIQKLLKRERKESQIDQIQSFLKEYENKRTNRSLTLTSGSKIFIVPLKDIVFIRSEDKYVFLFTNDNRKFIDNRPLKYFSNELPSNFIRVHRSVVINLDMVVEINKDMRSRFGFKLNHYPKKRIWSGEKYHEEIRRKLELK